MPSLPIWEKLIETPGFEAIATEDMITYFGSLLKDTNRNGSSGFVLPLLEFNSGG